MNEQIFQALLFLGSAMVGILGFFFSRFIGGTDKTTDKVERVSERNDGEIVTLKLTLERLTALMGVVERDMKNIADDARTAVAMMRTVKDLQEDVVKNKGSLEAAWKAIEELRHDLRKAEGTLVLTRGRKPRSA